MLLEIEKTVVEGAGAVGWPRCSSTAGASPARRVGLVLSGGNIEPLVLAEIIQRGMVKSGRLARLRLDIRDVPGALADVATLLGKRARISIRCLHQRAFTSLSVERAEIEVVDERAASITSRRSSRRCAPRATGPNASVDASQAAARAAGGA